MDDATTQATVNQVSTYLNVYFVNDCFVTGKLKQPSPIFVGKARSQLCVEHLSVAPPE